MTGRGTGGEIIVDDIRQGNFATGPLASAPTAPPSDQSTKPPVEVMEGLSGVPGGVIIAGITFDTARMDRLVVETSDGVKVDVPSVRLADLNVVAFAVPVASDLDLTLDRFLDDTGAQRYELSIPRFPRAAAGSIFEGPLSIDGQVVELFGS